MPVFRVYNPPYRYNVRTSARVLVVLTRPPSIHHFWAWRLGSLVRDCVVPLSLSRSSCTSGSRSKRGPARVLLLPAPVVGAPSRRCSRFYAERLWKTSSDVNAKQDAGCFAVGNYNVGRYDVSYVFRAGQYIMMANRKMSAEQPSHVVKIGTAVHICHMLQSRLP